MKISNFKFSSHFRSTALLLATTAILTPSVFAQRQAPDRSRTRDENRARIEQMAPEQRQQYFQERMQERLKNMTPEQRQRFEAFRSQMGEMQRQQQVASASGEDRQKFLMQSAGVNDPETQNAIIAFVMEQARQRQPVTDAALKLSELLADKSAADEAIAAQQKTLSAASKAFRVWKEGALKELDSKINFSASARLKSLLMLVGIIGDEGSDAGGFNAIFPKGLAGGGDITSMLPPAQDPISAMLSGNRGAAQSAN
jgi:hypothetical protein